MRALARLALGWDRSEQSVGILTRLIAYLQEEGYRGQEVARAAQQLARAHWRLGNHDDALRWCREAVRLLPEAMRRERMELTNLERALAPLAERRPPAGRGTRTAGKGK
jgi:tetratricopeptide (TPR) repeat protein